MNLSSMILGKSARVSGNTKGVLWMMLAMAIAMGIDVSAKLVNPDVPLSVLIVVRAMMTLAMLTPLLMIKGRSLIRTQRPGLHIFRGALWYTSLFLVFFALRHLSVAEVNAIIFIEPLITLFLAVLLLSETLTIRKIFAVALGLVGVGIVTWPQLGDGGFSSGGQAVLGVGACILSAAFFGIMTISGKWMVRTETNFSMLFYPQFVALVLFGGPALHQWVTPSAIDFGLILMVAICALGTNYSFLRAVRVAEPSAIAPAVYSSLPFAVIMDYLIFDDLPSTALWIGSTLVVISVLSADRK